MKIQAERAKIGLGIVTHNRPDFYMVAAQSVLDMVGEKLDWLAGFHDGPDPGYPKSPIPLQFGRENRGVAYAKNQLLKAMLEFGCTHIFLMEDDMEIISPKVIAMYIAGAKLSGIPHLNFSQHGPNKITDRYSPQGPVNFWPNGCGAFSYYTRSCLLESGLMDENFVNAYEHVEHSWRIYKGKLSFGLWPDILDSEQYIREQEDAVNKPMTKQRLAYIKAARNYWFKKDADCPLIKGVM